MSEQADDVAPGAEEEARPQVERDARGRKSRGRGSRLPAKERRPEPALNLEELRELVELIRVNGLTDFELEREGFRIRLRRDFAPETGSFPAPPPAPSPALTPTPTTAVAPPVSPAEEAGTVKEEDLFIITAPIVGTFYRSPSPTAEAFVKVGGRVEHDTVVCIIEAMKLMNEIQAETSGEVVKIYVENGQPVEYGQKLFGIKK